jgi:pimeloyl-ACP methyl ester carboxylesterase
MIPAARALAHLVVGVVVAACGSASPSPTATAAIASPTAAVPSPAITEPDRPTVGPVGTACLMAAEQRAVVRFPSDSGADLGGVILGTGSTGVVLAHETNSSLCEWLPYGRRLAAVNRVLAIDLNGLGSSPPSPPSPGRPGWDRDVAAGALLLRARGATRVVLVGANIGAIASLVAATEVQPPVAGVVVLSAQVEMSGLDGRAAAAIVAVPVLYVTSTADEYRTDMRSLVAATRAPSRLVEVDVIGHGVDLVDPAVNPDAADLQATIERFVRDPAKLGQR